MISSLIHSVKSILIKFYILVNYPDFLLLMTCFICDKKRYFLWLSLKFIFKLVLVLDAHPGDCSMHLRKTGDTVAESNAQLVHIIAWSSISFSIFCFMVVPHQKWGAKDQLLCRTAISALRLKELVMCFLEFIQRMRGKMAFSPAPLFLWL